MFISIGILRLSKVVRSLKLSLHKIRFLRLIEAYKWLKKDKMNSKASVPFSFASLYQALLWAPTVLSPLASYGQNQQSSFLSFRLPMLHQTRKWQPTAVFLPGKSCGQRSLVGCRPWDCKESDTTEQLSTHAHRHILNSLMLILQPNFPISSELVRTCSFKIRPSEDPEAKLLIS